MDAHRLFGLDGLVAVVTGGGSGLGLMMSRALAANGAKRVYILGRRLATLETAAASCPQGTLIPIVCDVTSKKSLAAAAAQVAREVGYVNLVIANAGGSGETNFGIPTKANGGTIKEVKEFLWAQSEEGYSRQFEMHVTAVLWTAVAFLELLDNGNRSGYGVYEKAKNAALNETIRNGSHVIENGDSHVEGESNGDQMINKSVNGTANGYTNGVKAPLPDESLFIAATSAVTSQIIVTASAQGINGTPVAGFGYHASKAAAVQLGRNMAVQFEPWGIRSNVLTPGFFPSELSAPLQKLMMKDGRMPRRLTPMERMGKEEEIGGTIVWMAGRAGAYCDGSMVVLDGGRMLVNPGVI